MSIKEISMWYPRDTRQLIAYLSSTVLFKFYRIQKKLFCAFVEKAFNLNNRIHCGIKRSITI